MSEAERMNLDNVQIDASNLYREESYTDLKVGSLQVLIPVKVDGTEDESRDRSYIGQTQLMSQAGPLPLTAPIDATTLEEAIDKFPDAVKQAVDKLVEEAQEMQRQEASRIVVPGAGAGPGGVTLH